MRTKRALAIIFSLLLTLSTVALFVIYSQAGSYPGQLQFRKDGSFKIIQLADLQDGTSMDADTKKFIQAIIRQEQPDLVVLSGDNVKGDFTSKDNCKKAIREFMDILQLQGVPVAPVFGNHDAAALFSSMTMSQKEQLEYYNNYSVSLMHDNAGTDEYGNYNLLIKSSDGKNPRAFNLWFFEAEGYGSTKPYKEVGANTLNWYKNTSNGLKSANGGKAVPSVVFQHIIPYEINDYIAAELGGKYENFNKSPAFNLNNTDDHELNYMYEQPGPPANNNNKQFETMKNQGDVRAVIVGHDHNNNYRIPWQGIDLICSAAIGDLGIFYTTRERSARVITLYENRANTSPGDIETRTVTLKEMNDAGLLAPLESAHNMSGNWTLTSPATCTENGIESQGCLNAGCTYKETRKTAFAPHTNGTWRQLIAPTCIKDGVKELPCANCDVQLSTAPIPAAGHTAADTWVIDLAPACTEPGSEQLFCITCSELLDTQEVPAAGHSPASNWETTKAPTCTQPGTEELLCTVCAVSTAVREAEALGHDPGALETTAATCMQTGLEEQKCLRCSEALVSNILPIVSDAHGALAWVTVQPPTCAADGYEEHQCPYCQTSFGTNTLTLVSTAHSPSSEMRETLKPTCTQEGRKALLCQYCPYEYASEVLPAVPDAHVYGEMQSVKSATCTETGLKEQRCTQCSTLLESQEIDVLPHTPGTMVQTKSPTCSAKGLKEKQCMHCETVLETEDIPMINHKPGALLQTKDPTCTERGRKERRCTDCNFLISSQMIAVIAHTPGNMTQTKAPTCSQLGEKEQRCTLCSTLLDAEDVEMLPHTAGVFRQTKASTCSEAGLEEQHCTVCDAFLKSQSIETLDHSPGNWQAAQKPTCTGKGLDTQSCTVCAAQLDTRETAAAGHSFGAWQTTRPATAAAVGEQTRSCTICSHKETRTIDRLKMFPSGTQTLYRKQQYSLFSNAVKQYGGNGLRFETSGKITVDSSGKITYKWASIGSATVIAKDAVTGAEVERVQVKVAWQWWQWILVIVLFGWIYL